MVHDKTDDTSSVPFFRANSARLPSRPRNSTRRTFACRSNVQAHASAAAGESFRLEVVQLRDDNASIMQQQASLEEELAASRLARAQSAAQEALLQQQLADAREQLAHEAAQAARLRLERNSCAAVEDAMTDSQAELSSLRAEAERLSKALADSTESEARASREADDLRAELLASRQDAAATLAELSSVRGEAARLRSALADTAASEARASADADPLRAELRAASREAVSEQEEVVEGGAFTPALSDASPSVSGKPAPQSMSAVATATQLAQPQAAGQNILAEAEEQAQPSSPAEAEVPHLGALDSGAVPQAEGNAQPQLPITGGEPGSEGADGGKESGGDAATEEEEVQSRVEGTVGAAESSNTAAAPDPEAIQDIAIAAAHPAEPHDSTQAASDHDGGAASPEEEVRQTTALKDPDAEGHGRAMATPEEGQHDAADGSAAPHVPDAEDAAAVFPADADASEHDVAQAPATALPAGDASARVSPAQLRPRQDQSTARVDVAAADASARGLPTLPPSGNWTGSTASVRSFPVNIVGEELAMADSAAAPAAGEGRAARLGGRLSTEALQWAAAAVVVAACAPCAPLAIGGIAIQGVFRCFRRR